MPLRLVRKGKIYHTDGRINGRRHRQSTGTASREHAEQVRKDRERDLEDRTYLKAASFADAVLIYLEKGGEKRYLKPIMDRFEATRLEDITPAAVSNFSAQYYGRCAPATVRRHLYTPLNAVMR